MSSMADGLGTTRRRPALAARCLPTLWAAIVAPALCLGSTPASAPVTTLMVPIAGTIDGQPESVAFSGRAQVKARVLFGTSAKVELSVDLGQMVGIGTSTGNTYVTATQEILNRPLTVADLFDVTFTFVPAGGGSESARIGTANFNLGFDIDSGRLIGAEAEVVSPDFPDDGPQ